MVAIATATHDRTRIDPVVLQSMYDSSRKNPLAPEPFLVRGIQAQLSGNTGLARRAFTAAELRNPRSIQARYFLAEDDFRRGDVSNSLAEIVVLARLAPYGAGSLAPYLAAYALDRSTWPQLRRLFRSNPELATATLTALANNPAHADVVLALAEGPRRNADSPWVPTLLSRLVEAGEFEKAHAVWAAVSRIRIDTQPLIFDPDFSRSDAPPPFNWTLTSSTVGLAERRPDGGLHVIYYGQEDGVLAAQLLILRPGAYRLTVRTSVDPTAAQSLQWRLVCAKSNGVIAAAPFTAVANRGMAITVGESCRAQQLQLFGTSTDMPRQVEVTIGEVNLAPEPTVG